MIARLSWTAGLVVAIATLSGCVRPQSPEIILLITLDTTRADRLGVYGYADARTPNLDALGARGTVFEQAVSTVPVTLPAHASMFTGTYPPVHGVRYNGMFRLPDSSVTVAERLRDAGWRTAAVPAAYPVAKETGIAQGFEAYEDLFSEPGAEELPPDAERKADDVTTRGIVRIGDATGEKLFLWLHYYDPHSRYEPPFPFSSEFHDRPYDGEIAFVDREIGRLLRYLDETGRRERTAILVVGDHGEGLYDHGEKLHCNLVYESTMRVPFLASIPGGRDGLRVAEPVSLVDVAPTILELAGLEPSPSTEGRSLVPALRGRSLDRRPLYFESLAGSLLYGWSPLEGVRRGRWKFIRSSSPELYDLESDPGEASNRYSLDRSVADDLEGLLVALEAEREERTDGAEAVEVPLDDQALQRLASLGYVGGSISQGRRGGPNPAEKVHLEGEILQGRDLMMAKEYEESLASFERVLAADPGNRFALLNAARAALQLDRSDDAVRFAERLNRDYPEFAPGWMLSSEISIAKRDYEDAIRHLRDGLHHHPEDRALGYRLGLALIASGDARAGDEVLERLMGVESPEPEFFVARALAMAAMGRADEAGVWLKRGVDAGYARRSVLLEEPVLGPLRRIPRFRAILAAMPEEES